MNRGVLSSIVVLLVLAGCGGDEGGSQSGCTEAACDAMVGCGVSMASGPDFHACFQKVGKTGPVPPSYCTRSCNQQEVGQMLACFDSHADVCLAPAKDRDFNEVSAIREECMSKVGRGPARDFSCEDACSATRASCESACSASSWESCIDCSAECGSRWFSCAKRC